MQSIEMTGKSVAEATKSAASKLGVAEDQLTVTVLEETKGLFGKSSVRVRAEVKTVAAPASTKATNGKVVEEAPAEKPAKKPRATKAAPKKAEEAPVEEEAPVQAQSEDVPEAEVAATAADGDRFVTLIHDLVAKADMDVQAKVTQVSGRYVNIELDGKDVAYLVGKHGEVLNALQYLVNIIAGRSFGNGVRATIDGNHYRNRREQQLTAHAQRVADEVKKRGEEAVLDALPAFERRIVHKALSEYAGVATYSEGEEPNRRVVIAPSE
ncbi:MAG: KH domain-containing protein [Chlorobia bacterium]|nr:KH domain-containing protein [Fimbriimonadaceae bacterium]